MIVKAKFADLIKDQLKEIWDKRDVIPKRSLWRKIADWLRYRH